MEGYEWRNITSNFSSTSSEVLYVRMNSIDSLRSEPETITIKPVSH